LGGSRRVSLTIQTKSNLKPRHVPFSGLFFDLPPHMPFAIALHLVLLPSPPLLAFPTTDRRLTCLFDHLLTALEALPGLIIQHSDELAAWLRHSGNPEQLGLHEDLFLHFSDRASRMLPARIS
jgi:hypothetical protein